MGLSGLKPQIIPVCPQCGFRLRYYARDVRMPIHMWVMTEETRKHLLEATCTPPALATVTPLSTKRESDYEQPLAA